MKQYFIQEGKLSPSDSCTNIEFSFDVEAETKQLNILFCYEPKTLNDVLKAKEIMVKCISDYSEEEQEEFVKRFESSLPLNNLLTISVDDPNDFRGAVHRHPNNQNLFISKGRASFGLIPGDIPEGKWRITISVHSLVTESCSYKLQVLGGSRDNDEMDSM